jgi:hypothetical protein
MYTVVRRYSGNTALVDALVDNQDDVKRIMELTPPEILGGETVLSF